MKIKEFSAYLPRPATLKVKKELSELVTLFEFENDSGRPLMHKPGQFIMLSVYGVGEAPFSVSSAPIRESNNFELAVRKIGAVTGIMHDLKVGDKVGIRGPYGSFFPIQKFVGQDTLFIAGGLGYIPLRSLLHYQLKHRDEFGRIILLVGTRNPKERIFIDQLAELASGKDVEVLETVDVPDETWKGHCGVITTLIPKVRIDPDKTNVAMVGPPIMYKFCLGECLKIGIPSNRIYVSLERKMKCGLGKCGHCQINHLNACIEGPVFQYNQIESVEEAI
ncbi:MAG: FAD/NAD(P)-binding protein [Desulfovibrionaceae bacterium]|nr:FAD/NAD(P)-binding protein [Desulfovibrionaceae bacterium]MBF0513592.1 FAD/NAD(P)-binding protein [Desulfovibrionaceae bacterium]